MRKIGLFIVQIAILKKMQKRLLRYLARIETPNYLMSGKKGISYIDNAKTHLFNDYIVTADITGFYSNCKRNHVFNMLINKFEMEKDIAGIITDLVCYENLIPTGSSTSQMIAYFTYSEIFDYIDEISEIKNIKFSLYVDDMTFSSNNIISRKYIYGINILLRQKGLKLKDSKTKYYYKADDALITGTVKDKKPTLRVPNKLRLSTIQCYKDYQSLNNTDKDKLQLRNKLVGKIRSAKMIEPNIFTSFNV